MLLITPKIWTPVTIDCSRRMKTCFECKVPVQLTDPQTEPGPVERDTITNSTLTLCVITVHKIELRLIPSLGPVLVLIALFNTLLPAVVCTDSEGPLAIGESQTEPGSVEICPITSSNNTL